MKYEIYCDESHPDVFWSKAAHKAKYLLIGGLWLPTELRGELKSNIRDVKKKYHIAHEIKWHKLGVRHEDLCRDAIDIFIKHGDQLRFRCIAVEGDKVDLVRFHESDAELGFYKFYYQMIVHWILDFNEYRIFCDEKTNRAGDRLRTLGKVLNCANISSKVVSVQALPSNEVLIIQLVDLLLGIASSRFNETMKQGTVKERLVRYLENRLGIQSLQPTGKWEQKFNIFKINLQGGW